MTDTLTIHISEYGYAAFSASVPLDFSAVQGCAPYYASGYSYENLYMKRVKGVVPAHFGMVIVAQGEMDVTVPIATREQAEQCGLSVCDNYFIATDGAEYHVPMGEHNIGLGVNDGNYGRHIREECNK